MAEAMALRIPRLIGFHTRERASPREMARMISESGGRLVEDKSAGKHHQLSFKFTNVVGAKQVYQTLVRDRPPRLFFGAPEWMAPIFRLAVRPHVYVEAEQEIDPRKDLHLSSKITLRSHTPEGLTFVKAIRAAHAKK